MAVPSKKEAKLKTLLERSGFEEVEEFVAHSLSDSLCPAICMADGCNYTTELEKDQRQGECELCGSRRVTSGLVLAGIV